MEEGATINLLERFRQVIKAQGLFTQSDILLLAVSGGIDSVTLCELCHRSGHSFLIAHCNFQLRGKESERDEAFVKQLGNKYGVKVLVKRFDMDAFMKKEKKSIQVAARELRYNWFRELIQVEKVAGILLTAHHADDNAETVAMNFFRGTGLAGLKGMPTISGYLRRPLLSFRRQEILDFAKTQGLDFVEDSSNETTKYTRNFFRHEVFSLIEKAYPQTRENLLDNISRFTAIEELYRASVKEFTNKLCRKKGEEIHIPVKQLLLFPNRALIYEIISPYGFSEKQIDEVLKLCESESGKYIQSPTAAYRLIKNRHWLVIVPVANTEVGIIVVDEGNHEIRFPGGYLEKRMVAGSQVQTRDDQASMDARNIEFPLVLRKWKSGDYFYPLGMKKKKKIARFLIDQKLSKAEKENVWVLESGPKIIWVVGMRIDDRFKVTTQTANTLQFSLRSN
jgi:tRNA(Ile)-lysidine synthase